MKRLFSNLAAPMKKSSSLIVPMICAAGLLIVAGTEHSWAQGRTDKPVNLLQFGQSAPASDNLGDNLTRADNSDKQADRPQSAATLAKGQEPISPTILDNLSAAASPVQAGATDTPAADILSTNSGSTSVDVKTEENQQPATTAQSSAVSITSSRSDLPATSLERRSVSKISLASVGLKRPATLSTDLNALIWSDSDAENALYLLRNVPAMGSAPILSQLVFEIMSIAAVPPKGAGPVAEELVSARLNWLAAAGQSDALSEIVRMLPEAERWAEWKRWQVEYDLIRQADEAACRDAERNAQTSLDDFWHQSRIICALLAGDKNKARFAADILKASGGEDVNFFQLVDKLLGSSQALSLDLTTLDSVDLVLMDAAHEQISLAAFEQVPFSMIQATSNFRYLAADAALKTSFMMLERGLQGREPTEQIWRALLEAPMPAEAALATLDGLDAQGRTDARHDPLASASLWVGLALRSEADTDMLIQRAFETEIRSGRPELLLDLYASLIRQRLEAGDDMPVLSTELQRDFALLLTLATPPKNVANNLADGLPDSLPEALGGAADFAANLQEVLDAVKGNGWQADALQAAQAWLLLPVLKAQASQGPNQDWTAIFKNAEAGSHLPVSTSLNYHRLSAQHLFALEQLAAAGNIAETALLASMLVQPVALGWIDPLDGAKIIESLQLVGLQKVADQFALDFVKAHLLRLNYMADFQS